MAVQALAPYVLDQNYNDVSVETDIAEVVEQALDYLSDQQCDDGAFTSGDEETCESTSQVILALCDMQIDPSEDDRFVKDDNSVADALESFKNSDGNYKHAADDEDSDALSTAQAMLATVAMQRLDDGGNRIFDFTSYEGPTED